jgi:hypothetical protein
VAAVKAAGSIEEATQAFEVKVVRAAVKRYDHRITWARRALDLFQRS